MQVFLLKLSKYFIPLLRSKGLSLEFNNLPCKRPRVLSINELFSPKHNSPITVSLSVLFFESMKRFLKKFTFFLILALVLLIGAAAIIAGFFEQQIGRKLITEINRQLDSELAVGDFELSLLSGFPDASANLHTVTLDDNRKGTLMEANNLSFRFGLFSLFGSNIKVHSVVIEDGALFVHIDKKGRSNYDILKSGSEEAEGSDLSISLNEAELRDVEVIYIDDRAQQEVKLLVKDALASGEFSSEEFSLVSFANLTSEFIELPDGRYLAGKDLDYDAQIKVNLATGVYELENVDVGIEQNRFSADGTITTKKQGTHFDLNLVSKESSLKTMIGLLPESYRDYLKDFKSSGKFVVTAKIDGVLDQKRSPDMKVDFKLTDGRISGPRLAHSLKDVNFTAAFDNSKKAKSVIEIADFKGYFNRELIQSKLKVSNLDDPLIDFTVDGVLPLASVHGLLDHPAIKSGDGEIEIKNFRLKGKYKDMLSPSRIGRVKTSGVLEFDDAELKINKEKMVIDKGIIKLIDNSMILKDVEVEGAGSKFELDGKFVNFLPVLFADLKNTKNAELKFKSNLKADALDLDRLIKMTKTDIEESVVSRSVIDSIHVEENLRLERFTKLLKGSFNAKVKKFNHNYIEGENFKGVIDFENNEMSIKGSTDAMDGRFVLDGKMFFEDRPYLEGKFICEQVDVQEFFRQSENFGQQVMQYRHVRGDMNAKLAFSAKWAPDGTFLYDDLRVYGDVDIENGELYNFELFYDFATYVKLKDLKHIKFTRLHNLFEIRKSRLYIPAMFMQSNALNLTLSGEHRFDNNFNYNIKINAGQVLFSKFKKYNPDKRPHKAKRKGWFNLYYRVFGNIEKYKTKSDKKSVKQNFSRSDRRKKTIQKKLEAAFGKKIATIDEPKDWEDKSPSDLDPDETTDDPEFIEGFTENGEFLEETVNIPGQPNNNLPKPKKKPNAKDPVIPEPDLGEEEDEFIEFDPDGR